jgi:Flp pilus assembly pilin Flp
LGGEAISLFAEKYANRNSSLVLIRWGQLMANTIRLLWKEEEAQDLAEYALLLVLVSLAAIASMQGLASQISNVFSNASGNLNTSS